MVRVGNPKSYHFKRLNEENTRPIKSTQESRSESPVFQEAAASIQESRDDECANEVPQKCSTSKSDDESCDVRDDEDVLQTEINEQEVELILSVVDIIAGVSSSHSGTLSNGSSRLGGVPRLKPTESEEQEFEDVLAELNATESGDGSTWLGSVKSETDVAVAVSKDDDAVKSETDAAVQKLIQSIKADDEVENERYECVSSEVQKLIDSVMSEAQVVAINVTANRVFREEDETGVEAAVMSDETTAKTDVKGTVEKDAVSAKSEVATVIEKEDSVSVGHSKVPEDSDSIKFSDDSKVVTRKAITPIITEVDSTTRSNDGIVSPAEMAVSPTLRRQRLLEAKAKVLLLRKHALVDKQKVVELKPSTTKLTPLSPKSQADDDDNATFGALFSDDTDHAVVDDRPSTVPTPKATGASSLLNTSSLRAGLLSKAKEMVDMYKLVLENDGFSGPEGEATRHFLTEMGSELKLKMHDSGETASLKKELMTKEKKISQLEDCVSTKNEVISTLQTNNISLGRKIDTLEEELDASKTREKCEFGRMEAKLASMELMHETVYQERDKVTLKSQSSDVEQLTSQNSTLLDLCSEKEEFIKDFAKWKVDAESKLQDQETKLNEATTQASHLLEVCSGKQETINELTKWKTDAEYAMDTQSKDLAELKRQNSSFLSRCDEQQKSIDELTAWKADATETLKSNNEELESLRTRNTNLTTQCTEQQVANAKHLDAIKILTQRLEVESYTVSRFEEDFLEHSKNMMNLKEQVQAKSTEVEQLQAKIDEINAANDHMIEQAKNAPSQERENQEKEKMAMKMNHHKELVLLKNQNHDLAEKIDTLRLEQEEFLSQIVALNGNVAILEKELKSERKKHKEAKQAVAGMEKALRVSRHLSLIQVVLIPPRFPENIDLSLLCYSRRLSGSAKRNLRLNPLLRWRSTVNNRITKHLFKD